MKAKSWYWWIKIVVLLFVSSTITVFNRTVEAQIVPDATLGRERSAVTPQGVRDLITGGAVRDTTLFHSFREFNVNNGQQVYFAPPNGIANIFTRVSGSNISRIFGTLGVNGGTNLFLMNPNGIIFGPNARLDLRGSFTATTARNVNFDKYSFSATNPTTPPLLKINVTPGLQYGAIAPNSQIRNEGNLSVGQDLNLIGGNLNLQGQLAAGENLNVVGNTVTIRDSTNKAFIATAGNNLLLQGNQKLDIFALNHPNSGLNSGGDMVLRSANTIAGNAHYTSYGSFRIEEVQDNSSLSSPLPGGSLSSTDDPVIRSGGDVSIGSYTGASLHIIAGGKVEIPNINITGADTEQGIVENLRLSDGTSVAISGNTKPTLDIRAGVSPSAIALPTMPGFFNPIVTNTATSADIKVGSILFADTANKPITGQVLLTNQYRPNPNLAGDIQINGTAVTGGGAINIDSKGSIIGNGLIDTSATMVNQQYLNNGGDVRLLANGNITFNPSSGINSVGLLGGNITLTSNGDISFNNAKISSDNYTNVLGTTGGDINVTGRSVFLRNGSEWRSLTFGAGNGGKVKITASSLVSLDNNNSISSDVESRARGNSSGVELTAKTLLINGGSDISSNTYGAGSSGDVRITTDGAVKLDGENSLGNISGISSSVASNGTGKSGSIYLNADSLSLTNGAQIISSTFGRGDAGGVRLNVTRDFFASGESSQGFLSGVFSSVESGAVGNAGKIDLDAGSVSLNNGAQIISATFGKGNAGGVRLSVTKDFFANGESRQGLNDSGVFSNVQPGAVGNAGGVDLNAGSVSLTNGAVISSATFGKGDAGGVRLNVTKDFFAYGESRQGLNDSGVFSNVRPGAVGNAGGVDLNAGSVSLNNGAQIISATFGKGDAGGVRLNVTGDFFASGENSQGFLSGVFSSVEPGAVGNAGKIDLDAGSVSLNNGAQIISATFGKGDAGGVRLSVTRDFFANGESRQGLDLSGVSSNVQPGAVGNAGGVDFNAGSVSLTNGAVISSVTFGKGDAGGVRLNVTRDFFASGESRRGLNDSGVFSNVRPGAVGNAGGVDLNAGSVSLTNGGQISSSTDTQGNAGGVRLNVTGDFFASGENSQGFLSGVFSNVNPGALGHGGKIDLDAGSVSLTNGAQIISATFGKGDAGGVRLSVTGDFFANGESRLGFGSGVFTSVEPGAVGHGGNIDLDAGSVSLNNGAQIASGTFGKGDAGGVRLSVTRDFFANGEDFQGNGEVGRRFPSGVFSTVETEATGKGGNIELSAGSVSLRNGGQINSDTLGQGNAGDLKINVSGKVQLDGESRLGGIGSQISSSANSGAMGNPGNIDLSAASIDLTNGGSITTASGNGRSNAGNIAISSNQLRLSDRSKITATTLLGNGGNIFLNLKDFLLLCNHSNISTTAGLANAGGNGGNININSGFVVAIPGEDSDISANAYNGRGGNINIITNGIYGIQYRTQNTDFSDITASSQFGSNGTVNLLIPEIDPTAGLTQLPFAIIDPADQIIAGCPADRDARFVVTGRGGIPEDPRQALLGQVVMQDFRSPAVGSNSAQNVPLPPKVSTPSYPQSPIVEAKGWVMDLQGNVILVANLPNVNHSSWRDEINCPSLKR